MRFRRSDRSRKVRATKTRRSSVFFQSSFISEIASPERRRSLFIEPLEDRRVLSVVSVTPSDLQGWDVHNFYSTDGGNTYIDNGAVTTPSGTHGQFTASPASPYGAGSYQEIVGTDGNDASRIETSAVNGTLLSNLTTLNYSTNVTQYGSGGQAPYMQLRVDLDGNGSTDDTLFFEPVYQDGVYSFTADGTTGGAPAPTPPSQGSLTLNTWQQWNVLSGGLWVNSANTGGPPLVTMANYIAAHPGAKLATDRPALEMTSGFGAGSWDNFIGNFDNLTVGVSGSNTTYDFNVAGPVTIDMNALGYQDGSPDTIKVQLDGSGTQLQVFINNSPTPAFTGAAADVTQLNIVGSSDDDSLTIDYSNGDPVPASGGLSFDGGGGSSNKLALVGYSTSTVTSTYTGAHSGNIQVGAGGLVSYQNLTPLTLGGTAANLIIDLSQTGVQNPDVVVGDDGGAGDPDATQDAGFSAIHGSTFEYTEFANPSNSLTIDLSNNADTITAQDMDGTFNPAGVAVTAPFMINGGTAGDTFNIQSTQDVGGGTYGGLRLDGANGADVFNVSSNAPTNSGTLTALKSTLTIDGGTGSNMLNVSESGSAAADTVLVTSSQISSAVTPFTINYSATGTFGGGINLDTGSAGDTVNVQSTLAGGTTTINTGGSGDTINVSSDAPTNTGDLAGLAGTLTIDGGAGSNTLNVSESGSAAADTVLVTSSRISSAITPFTINYSATGGTFGGGVNLDTGSAADTVNVQSTLAGGTTTINTGGSGDTINVSSNAPTNTGNLLGLAGTLTIDGGAGSNTLNVSESGSAAADTVLMTDNQISSAITPFTINYSATGGTFGGGVNLSTGSVGDTVNVQSTLAGGATSINTGGGADTINVSSNAPTNTGDLLGLDGPLTIDGGAGSNMLNVSESGSAAADTVLVTSSQISSAITPFTINYSATGGTFGGGVNLSTGSAGDTINVQSTLAGGTTTINTGDGADTINVSSNAPLLTGNLDGIAGQLNLDAQGDANTLNVSDFSSSTANSNVTLTNNAITGLAGPADGTTINYLATGGDFSGGITIDGSNISGDSFNILSTLTGGTTTVNGEGGDDNFTNILSGVDMTNLSGPLDIDGGLGSNDFAFSDRFSATAVTATLTNNLLTSTAWSNISYTNLSSFYFESSSADDTVDVLSTQFGTNYILGGDSGSDKFTVGNTAAGFATPGTGSLLGIQGNVTVLPDDVLPSGANDTLNVDASNDPSLNGPASIGNVAGGAVYALLNGVGAPQFTIPGLTRLANFAFANIDYSYADYTFTPGPVSLSNRLENLNVRASEGSDTIAVNATTATGATTIQGMGGDDVFTIQADALSGANDFQGDDNGGVSTPGNDTFFLNVTSNIGATAAYGPTASLTLSGDGIAGPADVNRNQLIVNDNNSSASRFLNFAYQNATGGDLNIAPSSPGGGLGGAISDIPVVVQGTQTIILNTQSASTNTIYPTIIGVAGSDDKLTVAELPTTAGSGASVGGTPLLPNGVVAGRSVTAFLNGSPYLQAPPTGLNNPGNLPGVAGGGGGPDLLINGIAEGVNLEGGGNSNTAGQGDQAVVYAASESDLVDSTPGATDVFGLGAGVLQAGFGAGNAFDTIDVNDGVSGPDAASITNNAYGSLVPVAIDPASFAQFGPAFASQQPGFIIDGGDEATPTNPPFLPGGVADDFFVRSSTDYNIQVNGNLPNLTSFSGVPQGDQLHVAFPGSINVFSDGASPPNVTINGQTNLTPNPFGVKYSSIERVDLTPGNGIVNIAGDNGVAGSGQNDYFKIRGGIDPFLGGTNGVGQFSLQLGGNWNPATGDVGTPPSGGLSSVIWFNGVTRINASGGAISGFDANGNAIPAADPNGVNALDITPYADNTPQGWGIETYWNQGNQGPSGGQPNPDLLIYNGVSGVSDNIVVQPSASAAQITGPAGQIIDTMAGTNTPIAIINYTLNANIIVNASSPSGTVGDTDTLTLLGTDPASAGASGNDNFDVDLTRAGTVGNELVKVADATGGSPLYNIQNFTNFGSLNISTLGGRDTVALVGRNDGKVNLNVTGGNNVVDVVNLPGVAGGSDLFQAASGSNGVTNVFTQRAGATAFTKMNLSGFGHLNVDGGGGTGFDQLQLFGTTGNDTFTISPTDALNGQVTIAGYPAIGYAALGTSTSEIDIVGNGAAGGENDSVSIVGSPSTDAYAYTPGTPGIGTSGILGLTTGGNSVNLDLFAISHLSLDAAGGTNTLAVTPSNAVVTPGASSGSGVVTATDVGGHALLPLSYSNISTATVSGGTLVVDATVDGSTVNVLANGHIVVTDNQNGTNTYDASGYTNVVINVSGANSQVSVTPGAAFGIQVFGDVAGNTVLNYNGDGANSLAVNVDAHQVAEGALTPVTFANVKTVNVDGNGKFVDFSGNSGAESLVFTPISATLATVVANNGGPLFNVSNASSLQETFTGTANSLTINGHTSGLQFSASATQVLVSGDVAMLYTPSAFSSVTFNGVGGNNSLLVDSSGGAALNAGIIVFNGGTGSGNSLTLSGGTATSDIYTPGPNGGQGTSKLVIGGKTELVSFNNLTPVIDNVVGALTVNGTTGNDAITAGAIANQVTVNNLESITFASKTSLTLTGNGGNDLFNISPANITLTGGSPTIAVNGAAGANDALTVNGTATTGYNPTGAGVGDVTTAGNPTVHFTNMASAAIVGDGTGDTLTLNNAAILFAQFTAGATADSGSLTMQFGYAGPSATPLSFSNLGFSGGITVPGGGFGSLDINGPNLASSFNVSPAGVVQIFKPLGAVPVTLPITTTDAAVRLIGHSGNDIFNVPGNQPFAFGLQVQGNTGNNTLNFTGDGSGTVTINLANQTITEAGFGTVSFLNVQNIDIVANADVSVLGTAGNDNLGYTPTGTGAGTLTLAGLNATFNLSAVGNLSLDALGGINSVTVNGTSGADTITALPSGADTTVQVGALLTVALVSADTQGLIIQAGQGNDTLSVNSTGSTNPVAIPITYDGGSDINALTLRGTGTADTYTPGPQLGSGSSTVVYAGGTQVVNFVNLAPVFDFVAAPLAVNGTNADNAINYSVGFNSLANFLSNTSNTAWGQVSVDGYEPIEFINKTTLTINGLAGSDTINLNNPNAPTALTAITVNGGDPTGSDTLIVNSGLGFDPLVYEPTAQGAGTVNHFTALLPSTSFTGIEHLTLAGQLSDGDPFGVDGTLGNDHFEYIPGATADTGTVVGTMDQNNATGKGPFPLVPVTFTGMAQSSTVVFNNFLQIGGTDSVAVDGTADNDNFNVTSSGPGVLLLTDIVSGQTVANLFLANLASAEIRAGAGDDAVTVSGNISVPLAVNGGDPSASDTLNFTGSGAGAVTVDLANQTITEAGFGPVSFSGVENINIAANADVSVLGGSGDDNVSYMPTGTDAGTLTLAGLNATFNLSSVGNLSLDPLGGTNTVTVNGNANANTIAVARGANTSVTVDSLQSISIVSADTRALVVNSGLGADTFDVSGSGGPADLTVQGGQTPAADILNVVNTLGGATTVTPGVTSDSGAVSNPDGTINFAGIKSGSLTGVLAGDTLNVAGANNADTIALQFLGGANRFWVNNQAVFSFSSFGTVNLRGQFGDDQFSVSPVGLIGVTTIGVVGGDPTASDKLIVNGTTGADSINFAPTGADAGSVTVGGGPAVTFATTESVSINGQGGQDALTYQTPANVIGSALIYTPGANPDSGTVTGDQLGVSTDLAPLTFANLGTFGSVSFATANIGRTDHLVVNGTSDSDIFNVGSVGSDSIQILKNQPANIYTTLPMTAPGVTVLALNGVAGDDVFNLQAPLAFSTVAIAGSGAADPPVANLTGDGSSPMTITLNAASTVVTGGGLGTVTITGVGIINASNAAGNVTIVDSVASSTLDVTPTSTTSSTSTIEGSGLIVNTTNIGPGTFNVSFTSSDGSLVVNGTSAPEKFDADGSHVAITNLVTLVPQQVVNFTGAASLTINGEAGSDTFNVTASAIPVHVNGGDPIGVLPGDTLSVSGVGPITYFAGPHVDEGGFQIGTNAAISFQQIESIGPIVGPGPVLILGTNGDDDIQVIARDASYITSGPVPPGLDGTQDFTVSVNQGPNILFVDASLGLYIDSLNGDDEVDVRAPAPNNAPWNMNVVVTGGPPAGQPALNGDNFTFETPGAGNVVAYQPGAPAVLPTYATSADGTLYLTQTVGPPNSTTITLGTFKITAPPLVQPYVSSPGGFESLTYDGQDGGNSLNVLGPVGGLGGDTFTHTPADAADGGTVLINNLLGITYQNLGAAGVLGIVDAGPNNTLIVNGTAAADNFIVDPLTGTIHVNNRTPITSTGVQNLTINGLGGDNTYTISAFTPYTNITVSGSGNSDPDVLNLNGDGSSAVSVNLGGPTQTVSGGGLGTVDITGVGIVNLSNLGGDISVLGTTGPDNLSVTPTGVSTATIQDGALAPVLNTANTGALTIAEGNVGDGDTVIVHGTSNAETINIVQGATTTVQVAAFKQVSINTADVEGLVVDGGLGADTFVVSGAGGPPLTVKGGQTPAADTLNLTTVNATITFGTDLSSGAINTGAAVLNFVGLQTINLTGDTTGALVINGTNGDDAINQNSNTVTVNNGAAVSFSNYPTLTLNGNNGDDVINVWPGSLAGVTAVNVNGGDPTASDTLIVNGRVNTADTITYTPATTTSDTGSVAITGLATVNFTTTEHLVINGQNGGPGGAGDSLTIATSNLSTNQTEILTPGSTFDSGHVDFRDRPGGVNPTAVPVDFLALGVAGSLAFTDIGRFDNLIYNGTARNDSFTVNAAGQVVLNTQIPVDTASIRTLTLAGLAGDDTFNVPGNHNLPGFGGAPGIVIEGGDPSASDTLNFTGDSTGAVTVDLANQTITEAGFAPVNFSGVEKINVAANADVSVLGGAGDDNLSYTPTGTDAGTLTLAGLNATFNLSSVGNLSLDALGGTNTVTVNGNANANTIGVARGGNTSVTVDALQSISIVSADTQALVVNSGLGTDTFNVSGSGGPAGLTIQGGQTPAADILNVVNTSAGATTVTPGVSSDSGTVSNPDGTINFAGIKSGSLTGVLAGDTLNVAGTNNADTIALQFLGGANRFWVNNQAVFSFSSFGTVNLRGQFGDDQFSVSPVGLVGVTTIGVVGGDPTASDQLIVNGSAAIDTIGFNPTAADAGSVTIAGSPTVNFATTESVVINGQGGNDALTYTTPAGPAHSILTFDPGATVNSGSVHGRIGTVPAGSGGALVPLSYSNIDKNGTLTFANAGGAVDTLFYDGTTGDDIFNVAGASIALTKQSASTTTAAALTVLANGINSLTLSGQGANDTFNLSGTANYAAVFVQGNGTADPSVTNLTGDGTAVGVNLGGVSTVVTGGGLGTVTITGNQIVNLNALGGAVTATDSTGPNTLDVTPTSATSANFQVEGQDPVVNLNQSGTFTVSFAVAVAGDQLVVNGTTGADLFQVSGSLVAFGLLAVNINPLQQPAALTVNGSTGADTFNVTPATFPIHVNGGDPIGVLPGDTLNILGGGPISFFPGPHSDEGGFQVAGSAPISYQQIESIGPIVGPGPVLITGTNGDDDIQVIARDASYNPAADGQWDYTVSVNQGPDILFINAPNLYIDALSGDDEVDVRAPAQPSSRAWNTTVTIAGGAPAGQPGLNGDDFTFDTPGSGNHVSYQPTGPDSGIFSLTQTSFGPDSTTITLTSTPFTVGSYTSSAGGFESAAYDGQGGNAGLTILGTAGNDTITHDAGSANDAGKVAVNSLLALSYKNLGATGSLIINGSGGTDTLAVDGTANNDAFAVDGTLSANPGRIHLNNRTPIDETAITNLVLNGYNPNNTFTLNAPLPYATTAVNSLDPAVLNLVGTPGVENIGVSLTNSQITGFGGVVSYVGVAQVNMNGNGGADTLAVTGTVNDDVITYRPTSAAGGTFSQAGVPVTFNFNIGAGNLFTVLGGGGNGGDEVDVQGNNAGSVITVDSPNRTLTVENALNVVLMPVVLAPDIQVASVLGGIGNNTFLVIPARNVPPVNDTVGPGFLMPNNLLVNINGGAVASNAALIVAGPNGAILSNNLFAVVNRSRTANSGVVRMFQSSGGPEPIQYPDISYSNVATVHASTFTDAQGNAQTLILGPDNYDPNETRNTAAYLGSGASINVSNLALFPNSFEHRFLQAEHDWFRTVAQFTGTMDFQVYFQQVPGFLPGNGDLQIEVTDAAGNVITSFGVNDTDNDERRRVPVVAGETYYLHVFGALPTTVNGYNISIINTPAPKPDSLGLNNIVAQGFINNATVPSTTSFSASDAAVPPPPTQPLPPLSLLNNFYVGKYLEFTSGALIGQRQQITGYAGATHTFTFTSPFSAVPALNDKFQIESNDTGRSQFDNVTRDNTPTIYIRLDAANTPTDGLIDLQGGGSASQTPPNNTPILIPFWAGSDVNPPNFPANNGSFRIAVYDNTNPLSPIFLGYANRVAGQTGVFQLQVTTPLTEGSHNIVAKVEIDSPSNPSNKDVSAAATFQMVVDTLAPPVFFGSPTTPNTGLLGSSDTGVSGQPATIVDRITADSTPTLYGAAEANAVVRLYSDTNNNGVVDNGDIFLGLTTATPIDGTNQFPSGQWQITSSIDLNDPRYGFPLDGTRHLLVTAEDLAGNVSPAQALTIFVDTQGPTVKNVSVTGSPGFNLFAVKSQTVSPTPLVNSLDITFNDLPIRVGPDFVYPAVNPILATTPGNYLLVGAATGPVVITSVTFADSTASGTPGMSVATLHFAAPLPDDRFTLTISDSITDNAGNKLDGEFGPTFPSGNGKTGGQFLGQFTVDSRPELATYSSGSVSTDLNGNFLFDPQNVDATNRDTVFTLGFPTDRLFAGKLADSHGVVNGFDKLGAYGFLNGQWRWLLDLNGDGAFDPAAGDISVVEPLAIDGLPVAGNWTNNPALGAQIGLFDGSSWWLDMNNDHVIDNTDVALGGHLTGNMRGLPIVGDFDGDGKTDLGTFSNGVFQFDLSSLDPGGKLTGNANRTINVQTDLPNSIGFAGVLARPVAADMDQDGITDIGLFVPGRTENNAAVPAEWYWLISNDPHGTNRVVGQVNTLNHVFDPAPLGHDLFAQFGNQISLPLVGNFDPPAGGGTNTQGVSGGWIQNMYLDVLGRQASADEIAYWTDQSNHGVTPQQIATMFLTSTERRSGVINALYQQYLGRQADQAGTNYWISVWNATGGPEAVQAGIIGSVEYYQTAGGTDAAWVTALYQNILGRQVDQQGLAYWTDYIKTHSKQSVVMGFVTSDEYRLGLINGWFQVYLGRTLDTAGGQFWLNQMKLGETQEQIQAGILGSVEFKNKP